MGVFKNLYTQGYRQNPSGSVKVPRGSPKGDGVSISYNLFGVKELDDLFSDLNTTTQKSIMIAAFRKAAKPLVADSKSNLLARTNAKASGSLYRSIGVKPHRRLPILKIGARTSSNWAGYHGHLIDDGTVMRSYITKSGVEHKTGAVSPTNFFNDALQQNQSKIIGAVRDELFREWTMRQVKAQIKGKTKW